MKNTFTLLFTLLTIFSYAQKEQKLQIAPVGHSHHGTVCEIGKAMPGFVVPAPINGRNSQKNPLVFEVTYGNAVPPIAQQAFVRATDILSTLFSSTIPIKIFIDGDATLADGTLAGAAPGAYYRNFPNAPLRDAWFPMPLAEKIAGIDYTDNSTPFDITIDYNTNVNWNYTSAGLTSQEFDFVTVMLHEILHGLGFSAGGNVSANTGSLVLSPQSPLPTAYNLYLENAAGQNLVDSYEDGSIALGTQLRSNNIFTKTPSFILNDTRAKIYAPGIFSQGSSLSHLDRFTYAGTPHSLMTPSINQGAVVHNPGTIALDILYDLGWSFTQINHEEGTGTEDVTLPFEVVATVNSDDGFDANSVTLHYSQDSFKTETVLPMTRTGGTAEFKATIPAPNEVTVYQYYISLKDNREIQFVAPAEAPNPLFFEFFYAIDETLPEIVHEPVTTLDDQTTLLTLEASVTDFFTGVNEVKIEYKINGISQPDVLMEKDFTDGFRPDLYVGNIELPAGGLNEGDVLEYRIVANDKSPARNTVNTPDSGGFNEIEISKILTAIDLYVNDFEVDENDFNGNGFSITTPSGFTNGAIHSIHPYTNAGENNTRNFINNLRLPVVVRKTEALIEFDEIVLVEPGEPGTQFTETEFWDYVIVEGRRSNSSAWVPFLDGYDSKANSAWLSAYNSDIVGQNSQTVGTDRLFKERVIDMQASGDFVEGDTVLIRFRLFSDPFAVGWGWAIDNLRIQDAPVSVEDFIAEQDFSVYPNPISEGLLNIAARFKQRVGEVVLKLSNIHGQTVKEQRLAVSNQELVTTIDVHNMPKGVYLLTMDLDGKEQITSRVVKQ